MDRFARFITIADSRSAGGAGMPQRSLVSKSIIPGTKAPFGSSLIVDCSERALGLG